jgi:HD-like signal output (HDOD) protein/CRP-like cAMP-binding protein
MFHGLNKKPDVTSQARIEGFSEREAVALYQIGKIRKLIEGEYLIRRGETTGGLILVLDGSFKILSVTNHGETIVAQGYKGSWFGNPDITRETESPFTVVASEPLRIMEIDRFAFNLLSPEIQMSVYRKIIDISVRLTGELVAQSAELSSKVDSLVSQAKTFHHEGNDQYARSAMIQDMINSFPRLPIQINKLTSMLLDEGASVSEIVGFAKMDPSIVSVVLKTVNSGYYNFQRKISDFHHAFVLLGFNQVYQILMENFLQGVMPKHFNLKALNLHSAVISQVAFDIAQLAKKSKPVMMSTLGILHDLGKCVVLVSKAKKPELDIIMARLNDCKVGSLLLDAWKTPAIICQSVEYQLYPQFSPVEEIPEDCRESVAILYIAHICFDYLNGKMEETYMEPFLEEYMNIVDLSGYSIEKLVAQHILPSLVRKIDIFPDYVRDFIGKNQTTTTHLPAG